ncbi:helix-turn-helix domain-containing protein [Paeniglutamicibacter psychrophenolicus]|uniref:helix-turn-helix domain-containing protein n=1 Tax=Paeniglutamicibacter psychrophenolicus TaxID=257454 RepID=UPI001AEB0AFC|nr:helix-turn-helix domain-containing protein [Paeniglutamicibacter psychrophenolicus]
MTKKLLNISEASQQFAMHPQTVRELLRRGDLSGVKKPGLRGRWKVEPSAIDRFIKRNTYQP